MTTRPRRSPISKSLPILTSLLVVAAGQTAAAAAHPLESYPLTSKVGHPSAWTTSEAVGVGPTMVNETWWVANALTLNQGSQLTETLFYERTLMEMYRKNPQLAPATALRQIQALRDAVGKAERFSPTGSAIGDQLIPGFLGVLQTVLAKNAVYKLAGKAVDEAAKVAFGALTGQPGVDASGIDQVARAQDMALHAQQTYGQAQEIFGRVVKMAKNPDNAIFRNAQDLIFGGSTAPIGATAEQLIDANPQLKALQGITQLIDSNGAIVASVADLKDIVTTTMGDILEQQKRAQNTLDEINSKQSDILDYVHNQVQRQAMADAAAAQAAEQQVTLSALSSGVFILSTLIGQADPVLGHAVGVVGNAAIEIGSAVVKFAELAAKAGMIDALGSMAGAALTGNIIGAALALLPLFVDSGPTPEQMIFDQLSKIREELHDLGEHMDARFDHVDRQLRAIYDGAMSQFERINEDLGTIRGDVADVKDQLGTIQSKLTHLEGGIWNSLSDGFRRELWRTIDRTLGYERRTGQKLPGSDYTDADSVFYTWATHHAYDQAATGPSNRDFTEANIADELAKYQLDVNATYLSTLPSLWGLPTLSPTPLPNAQDWYVAARAYISLQLGNPEHANNNPSLRNEIADLIARGRQLQAMERAVTHDSPDHDSENGLNPLFSKLVERYDNYTQAFTQSMEVVRAQYLNRRGGIDPFAGVNQQLEQPNPVTGSTCGFTGPLGTQTVDKLLGQYPRLLESYARSGTATICAHTIWDNLVEGHTGKTEWIDGDLIVVLSSRWKATEHAEQPLRTMRLDLGQRNLCTVLVVGPDPQPCIPRDPPAPTWSTVTSMADQGTPFDVPGAVEALRGEANDWLHAVAEGYRATLAGEIDDGYTADAAAGMTSIAAAIRGYVQLGLPDALASDEILSAMLIGDQRILDEDQQQRLTRWMFNKDDTAAGRDPWRTLAPEIQDRRDAVVTALAADLEFSREHGDGSIATRTALWRLSSLADTVQSRSAHFNNAPDGVIELPGTKVGQSRKAVVRLGNAGMGPMKVSDITVQGKEFGLVSTNCHTVPGRGSCTITIRYRPDRPGHAVGRIRVKANSPTGTASVKLAGIGKD